MPLPDGYRGAGGELRSLSDQARYAGQKPRTAQPTGGARLSIPDVIRLSAAALARNWGAIALITVLLAWLPGCAWSLMPWSRFLNLAQPVGSWQLSAARTVAELAPQWLASAAVTSLVVAGRTGERGAVGATIRGAGVYLTLLPYWLAGSADDWCNLAIRWFAAVTPKRWLVDHLDLMIAAALGPLLLALPFAMAFGIFAPVVVAERQDLGASIGRCWRLMAGNRWTVLGIFLLVQVTPFLVGLASHPIIAIIGGPYNQQGWAASKLYVEWSFDLAEWLIYAVGWVAVAATYLDLRRLHDGPEPDELQDVFA